MTASYLLAAIPVALAILTVGPYARWRARRIAAGKLTPRFLNSPHFLGILNIAAVLSVSMVIATHGSRSSPAPELTTDLVAVEVLNAAIPFPFDNTDQATYQDVKSADEAIRRLVLENRLDPDGWVATFYLANRQRFRFANGRFTTDQLNASIYDAADKRKTAAAKFIEALDKPAADANHP